MIHQNPSRVIVTNCAAADSLYHSISIPPGPGPPPDPEKMLSPKHTHTINYIVELSLAGDTCGLLLFFLGRGQNFFPISPRAHAQERSAVKIPWVQSYIRRNCSAKCDVVGLFVIREGNFSPHPQILKTGKPLSLVQRCMYTTTPTILNDPSLCSCCCCCNRAGQIGQTPPRRTLSNYYTQNTIVNLVFIFSHSTK